MPSDLFLSRIPFIPSAFSVFCDPHEGIPADWFLRDWSASGKNGMF